MHTPIVFLDQQLNNAQEARSSGPEGSGFDGTEEHPVTPMPTTHDRGADTMTESLKGTFEVHADGSVSVGNFHISSELLLYCGFKTTASYVKNLEGIGYKRRVSIAFPSGASVITAGEKIVARVEPEPKRPALTWNTKTRFDAFKGFYGPADWSYIGQAVNEGPLHPLQREGDTSKPAHASAYLLG